MELDELTTLIAPVQGVGTFGYNTTAYIEQIQKQWKPMFENAAYKEFDVDFHRVVTDKIHRRDKEIFVPTGEKNADGTAGTTMQKVKVARLPVPFQQIIVGRSVQFLTGGTTTLESEPANDTEQALFDEIKRIWKYNKLQFKNGRIAKSMMSQLEVCELWYKDVEEDGTENMCMNVLEPKNGFTFYPVFDSLEDLLAFGIHWKSAADNVEHFDLYTDTEKRSHEKKQGGVWELSADADGKPAIIDHGYGKIPIIYYTQLKSEWHPVQRLIERYEMLISNFADINDYNGAPVLFLKGQGMSLPQKGTAGKVIENPDGNGDAKYITWDQAPEAIKLEIENLQNLIYAMTQTAPIDFENMKGLGQLSGVAFDRILIDSHLKAREKQTDAYGEGIQRRINFLIAASISLDQKLKNAEDLEIEASFELFRIDDEADNIALLTQANGGKPLISQETSIKLANLTNDPEGEWTRVKAENDFLGEATAGGL